MLKRIGYAAALVLIFAAVMTPPAQAQDSTLQAGAVVPLTAIQKGIQYFEDMIRQGKADSRWRNDVSGINLSQRNIKGFAEYVVTFTARPGGPSPVSVFLNMQGGRSGSSLGD